MDLFGANNAQEVLIQGVPIALLAVLIVQAVKSAFNNDTVARWASILAIIVTMVILGIDAYIPSVAKWMIPALWAGAGGPVVYEGLRKNFESKKPPIV